MWELTPKRKENLVKFCLSAFTINAGGLIIPSVLQVGWLNVTMLLIGVGVGISLIFCAYFLER